MRIHIAILASLAMVGSLEAQQSGQIGEIVAVYTDHELPPATLEAASSKVAVIARIRILESEVKHKKIGRSTTVPVTEHIVELLEVLKGTTVSSGNQVTVTQVSVEEGRSKAKHQSGGRVFRPGEEYVLFLEQPTLGGSLSIAWGAGGAFRLDVDSASIPHPATRMWHYRAHVPRSEFLASIRAAQGRQNAK